MDQARLGATGRDDVRAGIVLGHDALAQWVARRYRGSGLEPDDLAQEARLGLLRAYERFDPARGVRFATYAPWWVRRTLQEAVGQQQQAKPRRGGVRPPRIDDRLRGVATPGAGLPDAAERVRACLRRLPPAEAAVLRLRHGLEGCAPRTRRSVARLFALNPDAVIRIERRALARLTALLEEQRRRGVE